MKSRKIIILLPLIFAFLLIGASLAFSAQAQAQIPDILAPATTFTVTQITNNSIVDTSPVMAVDQNGFVHVAYVGGDIVHYLTNASGAWVDTIVGGSYKEFNPSIAVDNAGYAHISYFSGDMPPFSLYYVTNAENGVWGGQFLGYVTCQGQIYADGGIAVDGSGNPYVVYVNHDGNDHEIEMRYNDGTRLDTPNGGWVLERITDNNNNGDGHPSIAVDANGKVHIAYDSFTDHVQSYDIYYATNISGTWSHSLAVDLDSYDQYPSIAVDSQQKVHIAFMHSYTNGYSIHYTTNLTGSWNTESVVFDTDHFYTYPTLAIDNLDQIHISYQTMPVTGTDVYVSHATNASGDWVHSDMNPFPIDDILSTMDRNITIDKDGYVHIVHRGNTDGDYEIYHAKSDQPFSNGDGTCAVPLPITCGEQLAGDTAGLSNNINTYGCSSWDESGPEEIWTFSLAPGNNYSVTAELLGVSADLDIFLLDPVSCDLGQCLGPNSYGDWSASVNSLTGGNTFYIAVDGRDGAQGSYTMRLNCEIASAPHLPQTPSSLQPANGATGVSTSPLFSWVTGDEDGDTITGSVYGSITNPPSFIPSNLWCTDSAQGNPVTQQCTVTNLAPNTTYYWFVQVFDGGESVESPILSFTTGSGTTSQYKIFLPRTIR